MKMTHLFLPFLLATIDPPGSGSGIDAQLWIGVALLLIGIVLVVRCVVRGHESHDLRSLWGGIALLIAAVTVWLWPVAPSASLVSARARMEQQHIANLSPEALAARQVIARRCSACHSSHTTMMSSAPWGLNFDQPGAIDRLAPDIYRQVVVLHNMPVGNITHITTAERATIARWYQQQMHPPTATPHEPAER